MRRIGERAFQVWASPGRPPKLANRQRQHLLRLRLQESLADGYRTDLLWTTPRVAEVIERPFGVRYHPKHLGGLLHALHWMPQKPGRRALQRDEVAIARWKRVEWPRGKNTAQLGPHLALVGESGFLLIPSVRRIASPTGQPSLLHHHWQRHDRLLIIPGPAVSPRRQNLGVDEKQEMIWQTGVDSPGSTRLQVQPGPAGFARGCLLAFL